MKIRYPLAAAALVLLGSIQEAEASPMMQIAVDLYGWYVATTAVLIVGVWVLWKGLRP